MKVEFVSGTDNTSMLNNIGTGNNNVAYPLGFIVEALDLDGLLYAGGTYTGEQELYNCSYARKHLMGRSWKRYFKPKPKFPVVADYPETGAMMGNNRAWIGTDASSQDVRYNGLYVLFPAASDYGQSVRFSYSIWVTYWLQFKDMTGRDT